MNSTQADSSACRTARPLAAFTKAGRFQGHCGASASHGLAQGNRVRFVKMIPRSWCAQLSFRGFGRYPHFSETKPIFSRPFAPSTHATLSNVCCMDLSAPDCLPGQTIVRTLANSCSTPSWSFVRSALGALLGRFLKSHARSNLP
jgi:hypothetical protein